LNKEPFLVLSNLALPPSFEPSIIHKGESMPRPQHYSPTIERFLVSVLYHEARQRKIPMTRLANEILKGGLTGSVGWRLATESLNSPEPSSVARNGK
jgi:hypothetical protein